MRCKSFQWQKYSMCMNRKEKLCNRASVCTLFKSIALCFWGTTVKMGRGWGFVSRCTLFLDVCPCFGHTIYVANPPVTLPFSLCFPLLLWRTLRGWECTWPAATTVSVPTVWSDAPGENDRTKQKQDASRIIFFFPFLWFWKKKNVTTLHTEHLCGQYK